MHMLRTSSNGTAERLPPNFQTPTTAAASCLRGLATELLLLKERRKDCL